MNSANRTAFPEMPVFIGAIVFILAVLAIGAGKKLGLIDYDVAARAANIAMGAILVIAGNYVPKFVRPLSDDREATARARAADRNGGRALVLAGIVYALLWFFAPFDLDWVKFVASAGVIVVFLGVAASQILVSRNSLLPLRRGEKGTQWQHTGLLFILHGLFWAFAMILADFLFGDDSAMWMVVAFIIVNGGLAVFATARNSAGQQN